MNWYKKAQTNNLTSLILGWLRSARDQDLYIPDLMSNMDAVDEGLLLPEEISTAVQMASNIVSQEQGGYLTLHQQNLIQQVINNIQPVPEMDFEAF